jgi:hypothetical protein
MTPSRWGLAGAFIDVWWKGRLAGQNSPAQLWLWLWLGMWAPGELPLSLISSAIKWAWQRTNRLCVCEHNHRPFWLLLLGRQCTSAGGINFGLLDSILKCLTWSNLTSELWLGLKQSLLVAFSEVRYESRDEKKVLKQPWLNWWFCIKRWSNGNQFIISKLSLD